MLKIYRENILLNKELNKSLINCWIRIEDPTLEELSNVSEVFKLEEEYLTDSLDPNEVPRLEFRKKSIYLFTRVPVTSNVNNLQTLPMLFILNKTNLITVAKIEPANIKSLDYDHRTLKFKKIYQSFSLMIRLMFEIVKEYDAITTRINRKLIGFKAAPNKILNKHIIDLINYEDKLNEMQSTALFFEQHLARLPSLISFKLHDQDNDLREKLFHDINQTSVIIAQTLMNSRNTRDAYSTIMTNNLNKVIKLFTSLTVLLTIPTIVTSFYGMNVSLPFESYRYASFVIVLLTTLFVLFGLFVFNKKNWL